MANGKSQMANVKRILEWVYEEAWDGERSLPLPFESCLLPFAIRLVLEWRGTGLGREVVGGGNGQRALFHSSFVIHRLFQGTHTSTKETLIFGLSLANRQVSTVEGGLLLSQRRAVYR